MDEKLRFDQAFCAALTGLLSKEKDSAWCVNEAYRVAKLALARVNDDKPALTQSEEAAAAAKAKAEEEANGGRAKGSGPKGVYQRPAGA